MLTERQQEILCFIHQFSLENGIAPSGDEIGAVVGINSRSAVKYHIDRLVKAGYLMRLPAKSRGYKLTKTACSLLGIDQEAKASFDVDDLLATVRHLRAENDRLRREHRSEIVGLRREYQYLVQELRTLIQNPERRAS